MSLKDELGLLKPFTHRAHETVLNIVLTGTLFVKEGTRILQPFGLTDAHFNVLMLLKHHTLDGRITQTELGNMLLVNRANITGLIDRMEKAGLVRRIPDPADRRVNYIEMTEEGIKALEKANKAYYERIQEIMSSLSDSDYTSLCSLLETIRDRMRNGKSK